MRAAICCWATRADAVLCYSGCCHWTDCTHSTGLYSSFLTVLITLYKISVVLWRNTLKYRKTLGCSKAQLKCICSSRFTWYRWLEKMTGVQCKKGVGPYSIMLHGSCALFCIICVLISCDACQQCHIEYCSLKCLIQWTLLLQTEMIYLLSYTILCCQY